MNYYQHHIGDYLIDTAHLSLLEDGAYRRLIDRYFTTEAPITPDETALFRILRARTKAERKAVSVVLREFFLLGDDGWRHTRCDEDIAGYRSKSAKSVDAANKRWAKGDTGDSADEANASAMQTANPMPPQSGRNANAMPTVNQEPRTVNQKPVKSKADSANAVRLPADWQPDPEDIAFCETNRPELEPDAVANRFRDYWIAQPGIKGRKADWPATWRNWVRNERAGLQAHPFHPEARASSKFVPFDLASAQRASTEEAKRILFGDERQWELIDG